MTKWNDEKSDPIGDVKMWYGLLKAGVAQTDPSIEDTPFWYRGRKLTFEEHLARNAAEQ